MTWLVGVRVIKKKPNNFSRECRLIKSAEFTRVFNSVSFKASSREFVLLTSPNGLKVNRVGFVFSKKKARRSIDRNHYRRLHRECFRTHFNRSYCGYDVIVLMKIFDHAVNSGRDLSFQGILRLWISLGKTIDKASSNLL